MVRPRIHVWYAFNVHGLTHLAKDVRNLGHLNGWSAFPFENFMQKLTKLQQRPGKALEQLCRRVNEERTMLSSEPRRHQPKQQLLYCHSDGPLLHGIDGRQYWKFPAKAGFTLTVMSPNNTYALSDGSIDDVLNIIEEHDSRRFSLLAANFLLYVICMSIPADHFFLACPCCGAPFS